MDNDRRARYEIIVSDSKNKIVFIRDLQVPGKRSITNDAETVTRELNLRFQDYRIMYEDTQGDWDELVHEKGIFKAFKPGRPYAG